MFEIHVPNMPYALTQITEAIVAAKKASKEMDTSAVYQVIRLFNFNLSIFYLKSFPVIDFKPVCQYNEDCPPNKLCDRLNRICINPCFEDSCGENAECIPKNHGIDCRCLPGYQGNPYVLCDQVLGCRNDGECPSSEACINGRCSSPCQCGINAICEVLFHRPTCKCPPGYQGQAEIECHPPSNPCDPNPCGINALCELDNGNPICYCPKGLTGNPFKNCSKYLPS